jgi:hypothetical protein
VLGEQAGPTSKAADETLTMTNTRRIDKERFSHVWLPQPGIPPP